MSRKPTPTREQKIMLWKLLCDGKWHKAKQLAEWGMGNTRIIRAICEAEPDKFISTQAGYKRADLATDAELEAARNDLISRADKILKRAQGVDRAIAARQQPQLKLIR